MQAIIDFLRYMRKLVLGNPSASANRRRRIIHEYAPWFSSNN